MMTSLLSIKNVLIRFTRYSSWSTKQCVCCTLTCQFGLERRADLFSCGWESPTPVISVGFLYIMSIIGKGGLRQSASLLPLIVSSHQLSASLMSLTSRHQLLPPISTGVSLLFPSRSSRRSLSFSPVTNWPGRALGDPGVGPRWVRGPWAPGIPSISIEPQYYFSGCVGRNDSRNLECLGHWLKLKNRA